MPRRVPREASRRGVELVDIASPYTGTDRVLRVMDGLALLRMYHLGDREKQAAAKYLQAVLTLDANGLHCALAAEPGSASPSSRTPALAALEAVQAIKQAEQHLGPHDHEIVRRVVINGETLKQIGHAGHALRSALGKLADLWFGSEVRRRNHAFRETDAIPQAGMTEAVTPSSVAHASRKGVVYG